VSAPKSPRNTLVPRYDCRSGASLRVHGHGPCVRPSSQPLHCQRGFTLIEILVVVAILGVMIAIVLLNLTGVLGSGKTEAANVEAHQVQQAVIAYMQENQLSTWDGVVDKTGTADVCACLLNPGRLQAIYTISNGRISEAYAYPDGKWADCTWDEDAGEWRVVE